MRYTLTLQNRHLELLQSLVFPGNGHERTAYLLCGRSDIGHDPWDRGAVLRLLSFDVVPVAEEDILSSSNTHVRCRTRTFARVLKRAQAENLIVVVVHSHPTDVEFFSAMDDEDEPHLVELAQHRNGPESYIGSLILTPAGFVDGRVWTNVDTNSPLSLIAVVGDRISLQFSDRQSGITPDAFQRQSLAFGHALSADLAALRVGVVGCGATGSAVAMLLARLGVRRLFAVDRDVVEITNLSRLHGATVRDAHDSVLKVDVLRRHIEGMGLDIRVATHVGWVGDEACRDPLRACDLVFGCTDDHDGRLLLNRLAYFYLLPVFDVGFKLDVAEDDPPRILDAAGRLTARRLRGTAS